MVRVFAIPNIRRLTTTEENVYLGQLPDVLVNRLPLFRRWQDRQAYLLGRLLLRYALLVKGLPVQMLQSFQLDEYQRPYLGKELDFNISHTRGMVVCATSTTSRVGIDVEFNHPIDVTDFVRVFTPREYEIIRDEGPPYTTFFTLWTRKESVMKADGRGFYLPPASFEALSNAITIPPRIWRTTPLDLSPNHTTHLATEDSPEIQVKMLSLGKLLARPSTEPDILTTNEEN